MLHSSQISRLVSGETFSLFKYSSNELDLPASNALGENLGPICVSIFVCVAVESQVLLIERPNLLTSSVVGVRIEFASQLSP